MRRVACCCAATCTVCLSHLRATGGLLRRCCELGVLTSPAGCRWCAALMQCARRAYLTCVGRVACCSAATSWACLSHLCAAGGVLLCCYVCSRPISLADHAACLSHLRAACGVLLLCYVRGTPISPACGGRVVCCFAATFVVSLSRLLAARVKTLASMRQRYCVRGKPISFAGRKGQAAGLPQSWHAYLACTRQVVCCCAATYLACLSHFCAAGGVLLRCYA
jgi:hypothetical protein